MTTAEDMETLLKNFPIVEVLTDKLKSFMVPGDSRVHTWHPGYFRDFLEDELPEEYRFLVKKADFWDFSFVEELQNVPGLLTTDPVVYPALFKPFGGERLAVVPIVLFRLLTATDRLNASALRELETLLIESGHKPWFVAPNPVKPSDSDKRNALRSALLELARSKPKVVTDTAKTALHVAGFDTSAMKTRHEVFTVLEELLVGE